MLCRGCARGGKSHRVEGYDVDLVEDMAWAGKGGTRLVVVNSEVEGMGDLV